VAASLRESHRVACGCGSVAVGEYTACGGFFVRSAWTLTPEHTGDTTGELSTHYDDSEREPWP
jgi:hypothetical protein